jgi:beta-N-acetylhexosaminidase
MSTKESQDIANRVIIAGFEGNTIPNYLLKSAKEGTLGGVIIFKRNVENAAQVSAIVKELRLVTPEWKKPIVSVDQEGGRVLRLGNPLTPIPSARRFGQKNDPKLTEITGQLIGRELRSVGFTLNFAPVLDVDTNPDSPVIGDRSYGETPLQVIRHGLAFARGLKDGGLIPCAKHFPGHGDATVDSHRSLPQVDYDMARLRRIELEPFHAWSRTGLGPIMTAHVVFSAIDPNNPATTSRSVLVNELRKTIRFKGAILSDDLEMGAIAEVGGPEAMAVKAIRAGVNGLLVCRNQTVIESVRDALAREAAMDPAFAQALVNAAQKLAPLAYPPGAESEISWLESKEHETLRNTVLSRFEETT